MPFFKYSVPLRLISAQIFYPVVLDCEGIIVIGEALVDLFMHDSQLLQSQHWHIFLQNRIIFLIDFLFKDRRLADEARKVAPELIFYFLIADESLILIDAAVVVDPFEGSSNVANKMKQFVVVEFVYPGFDLLVVDFAEFAVEFFEDVSEIDGDVVGLNILQVSDVGVVDVWEILNIANCYVEDPLLDPFVLIVEAHCQNIQCGILVSPLDHALDEIGLVVINIINFLGKYVQLV